MVLRLNIDFISRGVTHGGPSTDWWYQLSLVMSGGLTFATMITLVLTPCLLMLQVRVHEWRLARKERRRARREGMPEGLPQPAE
jgi:multidrug efflux pump